MLIHPDIRDDTANLPQTLVHSLVRNQKGDQLFSAKNSGACHLKNPTAMIGASPRCQLSDEFPFWKMA
jgi:hypothetical protein